MLMLNQLVGFGGGGIIPLAAPVLLGSASAAGGSASWSPTWVNSLNWGTNVVSFKGA